jgi:hypothetical protein
MNEQRISVATRADRQRLPGDGQASSTVSTAA